MSAARAFLDTNILVYLYSNTEIDKRDRVLSVIDMYDRIISTQVLNEFCNVCIRKLKFSIPVIRVTVQTICQKFSVAKIDNFSINKALDIYGKYGYAYYDSLIIASALEGNCRYLLSEDMADGQVIEGRLTIQNIFAHENS
jgi:predicted nucleic acid-binding protein